jgi:hypothetical protein
MNMNTSTFFAFASLGLLFSCNEPVEKDNFDKYVLKDTIPAEHKDAMDRFKFPDSVDKASVIVTYYEVEAVANSVMFYSDKQAKLAKVIRYFPDGNTLWEHLKQINDREFISLANPHGTFVLTDSTVDYSFRPEYSPAGFSRTYKRTDRK